MLWNVFYGDAAVGIRSKAFFEIVFADLNAFRIYDSKPEDDTIIKGMGECQEELHKWGKATR